VVRFAKLIFSASGFLEPFCSGSIGLDLGHCLFLLLTLFPVPNILITIRCNPPSHRTKQMA
jgi:hypothetical protein